MKKIIDGKTYNTDTADFLLDYENNHYPDDFGYETYVLCRTKKGAFFLWGRGGALTRWAVPAYGGGACNRVSRTILLISDTEAREIVESECDADTYERVFGVAEEA